MDLAGFLIMSQSRTSFVQLYQLSLKNKQVNAKSTKSHTGKPPKTSQFISIKLITPTFFLTPFFSPNKNQPPTLQETNISHLGKKKLILFKHALSAGVIPHRLPNWGSRKHIGGSKSLGAQIVSGPGEQATALRGKDCFFIFYLGWWRWYTPKNPMEPQNHPIEKEHHFTTHHFLGLFILQGVVIVHIVIASGGFIGFCWIDSQRNAIQTTYMQVSRSSPIGSIYGVFTYIRLMFTVNVGNSLMVCA